MTEAKNGKILQMVTWVREDVKSLIRDNKDSHNQIFTKVDKLESTVSKHAQMLQNQSYNIEQMKEEKKEDRRNFFVKVGIMVTIISIVIGTIMNLPK